VSSAGRACTIFDKIEDSEETTSISDAAEASASGYDQAIDTSTKVTEDLQHAPNPTTAETVPEFWIEWSTENTDIGEPPFYILAGAEVDNDGGWQVSGEYVLSPCHPHAQPHPQSTVATVVFKTVTALGPTPVRYTKPLLS